MSADKGSETGGYERPETPAERIEAGKPERAADRAVNARLTDANAHQVAPYVRQTWMRENRDVDDGPDPWADDTGPIESGGETDGGESDRGDAGPEDPGRLKDLARIFRREPDDATAPAETTDQSEPQEAEQSDKKGEVDERELARELAEEIDKERNREIDRVVDHLNPKYDPTKSAYRENCTGVVQAYELQRRGQNVQPGPLEKHLRSDEGGHGGRDLGVLEQAWGRPFSPGTKAEIQAAFSEPGARGVVYIRWNGRFAGGHVFNVENVGGAVRFIDGQPTAGKDASHYFDRGHSTEYLRIDDLPVPPASKAKRFLEP